LKVDCANVYVRETGTAKGRGVYSARGHADGETVEACPVVLFEGAFASIPAEVRKLLFHWADGTGAVGMHCLALGYGSLYNHANPANMRYQTDPDRGLMRFIAVRAIEPDEELTVNYNALGGHPESAADTWFERMGVEVFVADAGGNEE
jgi:hypothetical protein